MSSYCRRVSTGGRHLGDPHAAARLCDESHVHLDADGPAHLHPGGLRPRGGSTQPYVLRYITYAINRPTSPASRSPPRRARRNPSARRSPSPRRHKAALPPPTSSINSSYNTGYRMAVCRRRSCCATMRRTRSASGCDRRRRTTPWWSMRTVGSTEAYNVCRLHHLPGEIKFLLRLPAPARFF